MDKLTDSIINKIKKEKISPAPKWIFLAKDYSIWTLFIMAIIIGGLAFAVILFLLTNNDWDIYKHLDKSFGEYLLLSLPYFWIIFLGLFSIVALYNYKYTKKGYRRSPHLIVGVNILASVIIGTVFFYAGLGLKIENIFADNFPYYRNFTQHKLNVWNNPERGLLSGVITKADNKDSFILKDFKGRMWEIQAGGAFWGRRVIFQKGERIKIIGKKKSNSIFSARQIRPWINRGRGIWKNSDRGKDMLMKETRRRRVVNSERAQAN